jgi:hypothetical protein
MHRPDFGIVDEEATTATEDEPVVDVEMTFERPKPISHPTSSRMIFSVRWIMQSMSWSVAYGWGELRANVDCDSTRSRHCW